MAFPHIDTPSGGLLTAADLDAARRESTGRIYQFARHCPPCDGLCRQGRHCNAASWAPEGSKQAEPAPTKTGRDVTGARIGAVLLLVSATTVIGVIGAAVVARWPMAWPLG